MLTAQRQIFVIEYCKDWNATQAYMRAFKCTNERTAGTEGWKLLQLPEIVAAVELRKEELAAAAGLTQEWVLRHWKAIVEADPNELSQVRRVNCRHCHGYGGHYQWTEREYESAVNRAIKFEQPLPEALGGFGFSTIGRPNPACTECAGEGLEGVHIPDTRDLTGNAKRLYNGVKKTKDGVQILMLDRDAALTNVAKYFGMSKEQVMHTTDDSPKGLGHFYGKPDS